MRWSEPLMSYCQGNNLHIELQEAVKRRTRPHQYEHDSSGECPNLQVPGAHTNDHVTWTLHTYIATAGRLQLILLKRLNWFKMDSRILNNFYMCKIKNILTSSINPGKAEPPSKGKLSGSKICPAHLQHYRKKASQILTDPAHPSNRLFQLLPSGRQYHSFGLQTTRLFGCIIQNLK